MKAISSFTKCLASKVKYGYGLTINDVRKEAIKAQYAVRGEIMDRAYQIKKELTSASHQYPFKEIIECNIGNPQLFGQKPLTFNREVLSAFLLKQTGQKINCSSDVENRLNSYGSSPQEVAGIYTHSLGFEFVRESIANFIQKRDKSTIKPDLTDIVLTDGGSGAVSLILFCLTQGPHSGVMIPIPQYPLYSAAIDMNGASSCGYYLDEESGWAVTTTGLQESLAKAKKNKQEPRLLVVINPGNPTGQVLSQHLQQEIVRFAYDHNMAILADEVYQENIYTPDKQWISFRKCILDAPAPYNKTQLFSIHSVSKGMLGECGLRGGYFEMLNIDPEIKTQILKIRSISLCSNTIGQIAIELMCNPPTKENCSSTTVEKHVYEKASLLESLKLRAELTYNEIIKMKNLSSQPIEGAMYAFPQIHLTASAIAEAKKRKQAPDLFYSRYMLDNAGIAIVPGSGFLQRQDTHHFRITTLILPKEKLQERLQFMAKVNNKFFDTYRK